MSINFSEVLEWMVHNRNIWNEAESQLCEKLTKELKKGEAKNVERMH